MKFFLSYVLPCLLCLGILPSCSKGYEVKFTNYYIEPMDSVVIGNNLVVFTNVYQETASDYRKIQKGKHTVKFVSGTKKVFYSVLSVSGSGSGKLNILIDGINQISVLED